MSRNERPYIFDVSVYSRVGKRAERHEMRLSLGGQYIYEEPGVLLTIESGDLLHEINLPVAQARRVAETILELADSWGMAAESEGGDHD